MTLAKKHYQRLWFPDPGSGGDIPSRAEYGMSKVRFDELFSEEFWRMVVDRVAQEAPDTLLLAEAFWLMEGYFVRTLGMHRVYNSAFMNMLRDEKNQEYRLAIKNTMEFDPQILKRHVNFMNNPDERTAVDQFGKSDKYFGICTMMVTLPGVPMFGHGQLEGFAEKYGMEFRYPKWHEQEDIDLVARHERQIFPLLRRRKLFAEADLFRLYDFYTSQGFVNEDVFAYSNQSGEQRALVVFHNRFAEVHGWINQSAAYPVKMGQESEKNLVQTSLAEALRLQNRGDAFTVFRDFVSGLEYIRPNTELFHQGLYLELNAYRCLVLMDFREVMDDGFHSFAQLNAALKGEGVHSIDEAHREHELRALLLPFTELVNPGMLKWLVENRVVVSGRMPKNFELAVAEADQKVSDLLSALNQFSDLEADPNPLQKELSQDLVSLLTAANIKKHLPAKIKPAAQKAVKLLLAGDGQNPGLSSDNPDVWGAFLCAVFIRKLGKISGENGFEARSREWIDERLFGKKIQAALQGFGLDSGTSQRCTDLVCVLTAIQGWYTPQRTARELARHLVESWLIDPAARQYLQVHAYDDVLWFNRESFEELSWWSIASEIISLNADPDKTPAGFEKALETCLQVMSRLEEIKQESGFQVEKLVDWVKW
jgi:hypothetical protein